MRYRNTRYLGSRIDDHRGSVGVPHCSKVNQHERGSPASLSVSPDSRGWQRSDLEQYILIQASFSAALAEWQQRWRAITTDSLAALAGHGIAISFRQSICGSYVATLLHRDGGGIDSGLCPSLIEARRIVLGHGLEDSP
jgi:hypothetical protein